MHNYGPATVAEFLDDLIVFRNLVPVDDRLPSLSIVREELNISDNRIPRKTEPSYAHVVANLLRSARSLELPRVQLQCLIFIGDTRMNDGTAFSNLCDAGKWPGLAFIGSETSEKPRVEIVPTGKSGHLYLSNRWEALTDFDDFCTEQGFCVDERTAVVVDLDKTALGARGRNEHVIDRARVEAVRNTVSDLLGAGFNQSLFRHTYDILNQVEFHPFTADNQDYIAYLCLIVGAGLYDLDSLTKHVLDKRLTTFREFIEQIHGRNHKLPLGLDTIHNKIYSRVQLGDPTPFKEFRYNEYCTTVDNMGKLTADAKVDDLMKNEILITQEVRALALAWRARGALLFGLSDKPDEASLPRQELERRGYMPIHRVETHAVGNPGLTDSTPTITQSGPH